MMQTDDLYVAHQPRAIDPHHEGDDYTFHECSCGHWHSTGSKTIERHREKLIVAAIDFSWPLGRVDFVKAK